jgi:hypothetical protein
MLDWILVRISEFRQGSKITRIDKIYHTIVFLKVVLKRISCHANSERRMKLFHGVVDMRFVALDFMAFVNDDYGRSWV